MLEPMKRGCNKNLYDAVGVANEARRKNVHWTVFFGGRIFHFFTGGKGDAERYLNFGVEK